MFTGTLAIGTTAGHPPTDCYGLLQSNITFEPDFDGMFYSKACLTSPKYFEKSAKNDT